MRKITFIEFAELKQGDGKGPKYEAGKTYYLPHDHCDRWLGEGVAQEAAPEAKAENEPSAPPLNGSNVRMVKNGRRFDVVGPDDHKFNDKPLSADEAEKLRARVLIGEIKMPMPEGQPVFEMPPRIETDKITFRQDMSKDGVRSFYVLANWPKETRISDQLLDLMDDTGIFALDAENSQLTITVANGFATYRVGETDEQDEHFCTWIEGMYEPAPEAPPAG